MRAFRCSVAMLVDPASKKCLIWTFCRIPSGVTTLSVSQLIINDAVELWSPKEMALFNACICRFEKEFDVFVHYVSAPSRSASVRPRALADSILMCRLKPKLSQKFMTFTEVGNRQNTIAPGSNAARSAVRQWPCKS